MTSSCIFFGDSPRFSHRYREKIISRDIENGPNSILGNLLPVSAGIGHRRFEVLAKYPKGSPKGCPKGHPEVALFESFSRYVLRLIFMMEKF